MRSIVYSKFGPAKEVLEPKDVPIPNPAEGEVLVAIKFSGANPSDAKSRAGNRPGITRPQFDQIIPNSDGSGIITAVGSGVDQERVGQRVWIWNGQWQRPNGTAAEYIALPRSPDRRRRLRPPPPSHLRRAPSSRPPSQ